MEVSQMQKKYFSLHKYQDENTEQSSDSYSR